MDATIFKKLKTKPGMSAISLNTPPDYPRDSGLQWIDNGESDFVHVFVNSKAAFDQWFLPATQHAKKDGLFWLSYPKSTGKQKYDINRDSLWDLVLPQGWHPVAQVSLDETWSAIRLRRNEPGQEYSRPNQK